MQRRSLIGAGLAALAVPAVAQAAWPDRPVRLVVPFAGGTTTDVLARLAAGFIAPRLGQPVVIDNRSGAGGTVGALAVAQASADATPCCSAPAALWRPTPS